MRRRTFTGCAFALLTQLFPSPWESTPWLRWTRNWVATGGSRSVVTRRTGKIPRRWRNQAEPLMLSSPSRRRWWSTRFAHRSAGRQPNDSGEGSACSSSCCNYNNRPVAVDVHIHCSSRGVPSLPTGRPTTQRGAKVRETDSSGLRLRARQGAVENGTTSRTTTRRQERPRSTTRMPRPRRQGARTVSRSSFSAAAARSRQQNRLHFRWPVDPVSGRSGLVLAAAQPAGPAEDGRPQGEDDDPEVDDDDDLPPPASLTGAGADELHEAIRGHRVRTGLDDPDDPDYEGEKKGALQAMNFFDSSLVGFSPQTLLSFYLDTGTEEHMFHDVGKAPEVLRGGYFLMDTVDDADDSGFHVLDPDGEVVYTVAEADEGLFELEAKKSGTYTFVMPNTHGSRAMVNFFFQSGRAENIHTDFHQVSSLEDSARSIRDKLHDIQTEGTYLWMRQKAHLQAVETVNARAYWFSVIELITLIALVLFQLYYIKGLITERNAGKPRSLN